MVSPSKDTIAKDGILVYMFEWFCSFSRTCSRDLALPDRILRLGLCGMVSNQPSLMEALLRGGEEGNRILLLGWLLLKSRKIADAWYPFLFAMIKKQWLLWFAFGIKSSACTSCQEQIWCTTLEWISHRLQTEAARWVNCYVALPYVGTNLRLNWSICCPMTLLSRILFLIC